MLSSEKKNGMSNKTSGKSHRSTQIGEEGNHLPAPVSRETNVLQTPLVLQCESFRSLAHVHTLVLDQIMRLAKVEDILGEWNDGKKLPITMRVLAADDLLGAPHDKTPVHAFNVKTGQTLENLPENLEMSLQNMPIGQRFIAHKRTIGARFPSGNKSRPLANLFHNRLVIAVDWECIEWLGPSMVANEISNSSLPLSGASSNKEKFVRPYRTMRYLDDPSFTTYEREEELRLRHERQTSDEEAKQQKKPQKKEALDIEHILRNFVENENLDSYFCDTCNKQNPATLCTTIHRLPDVLIMHLKRLVMNANGGGKIRTLVNFPIIGLDMAPYSTEHLDLSSGKSFAEEGEEEQEEKDLGLNENRESKDTPHKREKASTSTYGDQYTYNLYGVVNHLGGMHGGHYTAFAKCADVVMKDNTPPRSDGEGMEANNRAPSSSGHVAAELVSQLSPPFLTDYIQLKASDRTKSEPVKDRRSISRAFSMSRSTSTSTSGHSPKSNKSQSWKTVVDEEQLGTRRLSNIVTSLEKEKRSIEEEEKQDSSAPSKWLKFDDEFVLEMPTSNLDQAVITECAYLLFYERKRVSGRNLIYYS